MVHALLFSYGRMAPIPLIHGLMLDFLQCSVVNLVGTLPVQVVFYASLGLPEDIIQAIGCWSSQAWKIYIRDNPTVCAEQQLAAIGLRLWHHYS